MPLNWEVIIYHSWRSVCVFFVFYLFCCFLCSCAVQPMTSVFLIRQMLFTIAGVSSVWWTLSTETRSGSCPACTSTTWTVSMTGWWDPSLAPRAWSLWMLHCFPPTRPTDTKPLWTKPDTHKHMYTLTQTRTWIMHKNENIQNTSIFAVSWISKMAIIKAVIMLKMYNEFCVGVRKCLSICVCTISSVGLLDRITSGKGLEEWRVFCGMDKQDWGKTTEGGGMHRGVVTGHRRQWMVDSSLQFRNFIKVWF